MSDDWEDDTDPWQVKSMTQPFDSGWFHIDAYEVVRPDGTDGRYGVVRMRGVAVGVLPIEPDGRVHLVGQWRFPLERYSWEIPEGGAAPDEAPIHCARRELEEETGLSADHYQHILDLDLSNSLTDERGVLFIATGLHQGKPQPEGVEVLKQRTAHFTEVLARVADGRIRDALTVAAVLRAHHMAVTGQLPKVLADAMLGLRQGD